MSQWGKRRTFDDGLHVLPSIKTETFEPARFHDLIEDLYVIHVDKGHTLNRDQLESLRERYIGAPYSDWVKQP